MAKLRRKLSLHTQLDQEITILSRPTNAELDNAKAYFIIHQKYAIQVTENYDSHIKSNLSHRLFSIYVYTIMGN